MMDDHMERCTMDDHMGRCMMDSSNALLPSAGAFLVDDRTADL